MSNKETWKKELGISEYPCTWSSEDDDSNTSPCLSEFLVHHQRLSSTLDPTMPGPSGLEMPPAAASGRLRPVEASYAAMARPMIIDYRTSNLSRTLPTAGPSHACMASMSSTPAVSRTEVQAPGQGGGSASTQLSLTRRLTSPPQPGGSSSTDRHSDLLKSFEHRNVMFNRYLASTKTSTNNLINVTRALIKAKRRARTLIPGVSPLAEDRSRLYIPPGARRRTVPPVLPTTRPLRIVQSDDEPELGTPSFSHDENDGNIEDQRNGAISDLNNAFAVELEEEIVGMEVEPEPEPEAASSAEVVGASSSEVDGNTAQVLNKQNETNEDTSQLHGVKRKRESDDDDKHSTVKDLNQALLKLLECPVCLEWTWPPLAQCRRGHLVCAKCRKRLDACPVCRAAFSSVRNRAMEGVAELVRYPCRHGCGVEVRLPRRAAHEASCAARRYPCPACGARPMLIHELPVHVQRKHMSILKLGDKHDMSLRLKAEERTNSVILVYGELFNLKLDVDVGTWALMLHVTYLGPMNDACNYIYQVVVTGQYYERKLVYSRETHCDLESSNTITSRQDCFHMTLDQASSFLRVKNNDCHPNRTLNLSVEIQKKEN